MIGMRLIKVRESVAHFALRAKAVFQRRSAILMYHRIASPASDPWRLSVSPENFAAHMEVIRRRNEARPLSEIAGWLNEPGKVGTSIAVTFDDGYLDNLETALPIMEATQVPATIYVISGAVGRPDAFWWDFLNRIFLESPSLPDSLTLTIGDQVVSCHLGQEARLDSNALAAVARWEADLELARGARQHALLEVWAALSKLSPSGRREPIDRLAQWAGQSPVPDENTFARPIGWEELHRLAQSPLIEIGGHTVSHPDLSQISASDGAREIRQCRVKLLEVTGRNITSFGYPFGRFGPETCQHIADAGFSNGTCSQPGVATARSNRFQMPRLQVPNISGEKFERLLNRVLGPAGDTQSPISIHPSKWFEIGAVRRGRAQLGRAWHQSSEAPASRGITSPYQSSGRNGGGDA